MKVLGIDGALGGFSAAVIDGDRVFEAGSDVPDALEAGLGRIAAMLERSGLGLGDLDRIAVGMGPGSFTGVRIAVSYAKALALARGLPLVGISSYDILTPGDAPPRVLTLVGGRPGVVSARLRDESGVRTASGRIADVLDALFAGVAPSDLAVVGNTEDVSSAIAERGFVVQALPNLVVVPARAVARLALTSAPAASPHAVAPDYGELPAVTMRAGA